MKYQDLKYFDLDALEFRDQLNAVSTFQWGKLVGAAILDEVQKAPLLFYKIKYAYDNNAVDFTVLLGSAQILLLGKIRESLAGRVLVYDLWPLALGELVCPVERPLEPPLLGRLFASPCLDEAMDGVPEVIIGEKGEILRSQEEYLLQWGGN